MFYKLVVQTQVCNYISGGYYEFWLFKTISFFRIVNIAWTYLQPHYGNGVFGNVYLSAGQHLEVNIAGTQMQ